MRRRREQAGAETRPPGHSRPGSHRQRPLNAFTPGHVDPRSRGSDSGDCDGDGELLRRLRKADAVSWLPTVGG
jgi:hypothetical protein